MEQSTHQHDRRLPGGGSGAPRMGSDGLADATGDGVGEKKRRGAAGADAEEEQEKEQEEQEETETGLPIQLPRLMLFAAGGAVSVRPEGASPGLGAAKKSVGGPLARA